MRLGISSYTYVWSVGVPGYPAPPQPLTALGLLEKACRLGVHVVQIADNLPLDRLSDEELEALIQTARDSHIDLEVGTCGTDAEHLRRYLDLAVRLGSPLLRVVLDTDKDHPSPDEVVQRLESLLPHFERAGVCLAIENHDRFPAATLADMLRQLDGKGRHVGICLDTANSLGCGEGLDTLLRELGRFVVNLHVKDFQATRLPHKKGFLIEGRPAGQGQLDIPRLLAELRSMGQNANAIVELWPAPEATLAETIAKEDAWAAESVRYLRRFVAD
jgi:sugar phosphate isomerase/epimerase